MKNRLDSMDFVQLYREAVGKGWMGTQPSADELRDYLKRGTRVQETAEDRKHAIKIRLDMVKKRARLRKLERFIE